MRIRLKHERLQQLLAGSRLSQNHWARKLGLSRGHLSDLLKGRHPYVSARTREKLLHGLGAAFDDLFEEEQPRVVLPPPPRIDSRQRLEAAMSTLLDDLRYAVRVSVRHRLVTAAVVATMALGIGVTTAVYSIVHAVLLSPLPFEESDRVVQFRMVLRDGRVTSNNAFPDLQDYRAHARTLDAVAAVSLARTTITAGGVPEQHGIAFVDHAYDDVFRLRPAIGRFFAPEEYEFGTPRVVMISDRLWRARFGADPAIVGRDVEVDREKATIVGVLPPMAYVFPDSDIGFLAPLRPNPRSFHLNRGALWLMGVGRMRPGVTLEQTAADVEAVSAELARRFPDSNGGLGARIMSLHEAETGDTRATLILLAGAVATVLLIACVNVANLLLGHSHARTREFAVRAALGGHARRLRRQVLTEALTLAAAGGAIGISSAPLLMRMLVSAYPGEIARVGEIVVDWRVALAGIVATVVAGLLSGLPTARRAARIDLTSDLRQGGRSMTAARGGAGPILIASQVALSLALLFASALLVQTLRTLATAHPGFETAGVTTFFVSAPSAQYREAADIDRYYEDVDRAVRGLPGIDDVATSWEMPFQGSGTHDVFVMKERGDLGNANPQVRVSGVSPSYWDLLRAPIVAGRAFTPRDNDDAPRVAVVNEALAARYYPGQDPVGRRIQFNLEEWEIVGVAASMRMDSMAEPSTPELYAPASQLPRRGRYLLVRSSGPAPSREALQRALGTVDAGIAITDFATLDDRLTESTEAERFRAVLFSALGAIALVLSSLGIYAVLADAVTRRAREIGIRMALGEGQGSVQRRIVGLSLRAVAAGTAVGVVLALAAGRWLSGVLVGVDPSSLPALAGATFVLAAVAIAAAYIPARRASRVDPLTALRFD